MRQLFGHYHKSQEARQDTMSESALSQVTNSTPYRNMKNLALLTFIATVAVGLALVPSYARHQGGDGAWHGRHVHRPLYPSLGVRPEPFNPGSGFHPGPFHPDTGFDPGPFHTGSGFHPGPFQ
jgi:hypothetical protein